MDPLTRAPEDGGPAADPAQNAPAPELRPAIEGRDILIIPFVAFAMAVLAAAIWRFFPPDFLSALDRALLPHLIAAVLYIITLVTWGAILLGRRIPLARAGLSKTRPRWALITLALWTGFILVFAGLNLWLNAEGVELIEEQNRQVLGDGNILLTLLVLGLLAPIAEEIYFRGVLFAWLRTKIGVFAAAFLTSAFFAAVHTNYMVGDGAATALALAQIGTLGFICAMLYQKSGSLLPAIFFHMTNNLIVTVATASAL